MKKIYKIMNTETQRHRVLMLCVGLCAFVSLCSIKTQAQTAYSLEQLKQLAVENNYSLRSARNAIQQSKEQKSEALT